MFIISIINGQSDQARSFELVPGGHLHSSAPWASGPPEAWLTAMSIVTWETTRISSRTFSNGATQSDVKSLVIKFTFFKIASSISRTTVARTKIVSMFDNSLGAENMILLILFFFCLEWNGTRASMIIDFIALSSVTSGIVLSKEDTKCQDLCSSLNFLPTKTPPACSR